MGKEINYHEDLHINPDALDMEWLRQPLLFMTYAEECANARDIMERNSQRLDICKAEVDAYIRENPKEFVDTDKKPTESQISNLIEQNERYKKTRSDYLEARHTYDILSAAVKAFDQKKEALENLVRLYGQQYFSGPQEPRDLGMEWQKTIEQNHARQRIKRAMKKE